MIHVGFTSPVRLLKDWKAKLICALILIPFFVWIGGKVLDRFEKINLQDSATFEQLVHEINRQDTFATRTWRKIWRFIPNGGRSILRNLKPLPPADQVRIEACLKLSKLGVDAVDPILLKLNDPDDLLVRTALVSLTILGLANDETWDSISELVSDAAKPVKVRHGAFQALVFLHLHESRLVDLIDDLAENDPTFSDFLDSRSKAFKPVMINNLTQSVLDQENKYRSRLQSRLIQSPSDQHLETERYLIKTLMQKETSIHAKVAHYLLYGQPRGHTTTSLRAILPMLISDDSMERSAAFNKTYADSMIEKFLFNTRHKHGDMEVFQRMATNTVTALHPYAFVFYPRNAEPTPELVDTLLFHALGPDPELSTRSTIYLSRLRVQPTERQMNLLGKLLESPNVIIRYFALDALVYWQPESFEQIIDFYLRSVLPTEIYPTTTFLNWVAIQFESSDTVRSFLKDRIRILHANIRSLQKEIISLRKERGSTSSLPAEIQHSLDQACRSRSFLLTISSSHMQDDVAWTEMLDEAAEDSMNPKQLSDVMTRWTIDQDTQKALPGLQRAVESVSRDNHRNILSQIGRIGPEAVPSLEGLMQHEDEDLRVSGFREVCRILKNRTLIQPYAEKASINASPHTLQGIQKWMDEYAPPAFE